MNINTNLAGLAYMQKNAKDSDNPWVYDDDQIEQITQPEAIVRKQKAKRKPRLRRAFAVILSTFKK